MGSNLAVHTVWDTAPSAGRHSLPMANGTTMYRGMLACLNSSGYLDHWDDGSSSVFLGILLDGDDDGGSSVGALVGDTSLSPAPHARVDCSGVILRHLSSVSSAEPAGTVVSQANVGDLVYCDVSDPAYLTTDSSSRNYPIGFIWYFTASDDVDVKLFTPGQFMAQATDAI